MSQAEPLEPGGTGKSKAEVCADIIASLHAQRLMNEQREQIFDEELLHLALTGEAFELNGFRLDADIILEIVWPLVAQLPQDQQRLVLDHHARISRSAATRNTDPTCCRPTGDTA